MWRGGVSVGNGWGRDVVWEGINVVWRGLQVLCCVVWQCVYTVVGCVQTVWVAMSRLYGWRTTCRSSFAGNLPVSDAYEQGQKGCMSEFQ